jgi:hypothetical protein
MAKYEIVDDSFRADEDAELMAELLSGKTVFIPEATNSSINVLYSRFLTKHQRRLRRRATAISGKHGMVAWLDEPEAR